MTGALLSARLTSESVRDVSVRYASSNSSTASYCPAVMPAAATSAASGSSSPVWGVRGDVPSVGSGSSLSPRSSGLEKL